MPWCSFERTVGENSDFTSPCRLTLPLYRSPRRCFLIQKVTTISRGAHSRAREERTARPEFTSPGKPVERPLLLTIFSHANSPHVPGANWTTAPLSTRGDRLSPRSCRRARGRITPSNTHFGWLSSGLNGEILTFFGIFKILSGTSYDTLTCTTYLKISSQQQIL